MRLAVILPTLAGGGMERMRIHLIREWVQNGIEVDLVLSRFQGPLCGQVPDAVRVFEVARGHPLFFPIGLRRYLKSRKPTHILSAANDINAMTLMMVGQFQDGVPVVISVHSHLSSELALAKGLNKLKALMVVWLLKRVIHRAQSIIAVSQGVADDLKQYFPQCVARIYVVYNPVITPETPQRLQEQPTKCPVPTGTPYIVYAGRFAHEKGLDVLLDAFKQIMAQTQAHLVMMGDGALKSQLAADISARGFGGRVHLVDYQPNPLPWIRDASVLVLPSRYEGLPNVLIEGLACGTQIVATDCPGGSAEILDGGRYGQLVPVADSTALAKALLDSLTGQFYVPSDQLIARAEIFTSARAAQTYLARLTATEQ